MDIQVHVVRHFPDEIEMGHKMHFDPVTGCDGISATANMSGFTVLNAIKMFYRWDHDQLCRAVDECNSRDEVAVIDQLRPKLFLVPKTRFDNKERSAFYIRDLLNAVNHVGIRKLQFTHYSFISALMFDEEVAEVMTALVNPNLETTVQELVFDADARVAKTIRSLVDLNTDRQMTT
jgi:hypothetical protein